MRFSVGFLFGLQNRHQLGQRRIELRGVLPGEAAEDFAKELPGVKIEIVQADHQLKADVASSIARQWIDTDNDTGPWRAGLR